MPGRYLIIDTQADGGPALVSTDDVLPTALAQRLDSIDANLEKIIMSMAAEQGQIDNLADAVNAVSANMNAATTTLQQWIADHSSLPDLGHLQDAVNTLQASGATLSGIVPQVPSDPIQAVPDPGPTPDPAPDTTVPSDTPVDTTGPSDTAPTDTAPTDTAGATDGIGVDPGLGPDSPPAPAQF